MDWDLAGVRRAWEGHETPLAWGRYPVEHDPIRRHCHMVDDANPRFLARGECPPVMVDYFAAGGALARAIEIAARSARVEMFVWFTFADADNNDWQSGLIDQSGAERPAYASFAAAVRALGVSGGNVGGG